MKTQNLISDINSLRRKNNYTTPLTILGRWHQLIMGSILLADM